MTEVVNYSLKTGWLVEMPGNAIRSWGALGSGASITYSFLSATPSYYISSDREVLKSATFSTLDPLMR